MARNSPFTGSEAPGVRSHSSNRALQERRCSRLSARNRAAYFGSAMGRSAEDALDRFEHSRGLERFDDEVLGACLNRLDHQGLLAHGAAHQNLGVGILLADLADRLDPAHIGHHDVHRYEIGLEVAILLHRLESRFRLADDLEAGLSQDVANHGTHEDGVVADEDCITHCPPPCGSGFPPATEASKASMSSRMK